MDNPEPSWSVRTIVTLAWLVAMIVWVFVLLTLAALTKYVHMLWLSMGVKL
jgi:hypothetical protein